MDMIYIVLRSHPAAGGRLREGLELALAYGAYEIPVQIVFSGEAVLALYRDYDSSRHGDGDYLTQLASLPLYDIAVPWICAASMTRYGFQAEQLRIDVQIIPESDIAALGPTTLVF